MKLLLAGGAVAMLSLPVGLGIVLTAAASSSTATTGPTEHALADIPEVLLALYQQAAATCPGLPWPVLAAIGKVESNHGRHGGTSVGPGGSVTPWIIGVALDGSDGNRRILDTDGGRWDRDPVFDRAVGPMQFLPGTWARWGIDATGDGVADPHNIVDAVFSAAAYLCGSDGEVGDVEAAILSYNRSRAYLDEVLDVARSYGSLSLIAIHPRGLVEHVLAHPNLTIVESARLDLESGIVDPRVVAMLAVIAERTQVGVGVIRTGHSQCVGGGSRATRPSCTISDHWYGRAVDLYAVGGQPVSARNDAALELAHFLLASPSPLRPDSLGLPWGELAVLPGVFSDAHHQNHLHVSWKSR